MARLERSACLAILFTLPFLVVAAHGETPRIVAVTIRADSENAGYEAYRALDGDSETMWHTRFGGSDPAGPHQVTLDLGQEFELAGFVYQPRSGGGNGTIGRYECYLGNDLKNLGRPIVAGEFPKLASRHDVAFPTPAKGRYFRLCALSEVNGRPWASIAELQLLVDGVTFRAKNAGPTTLVHDDGSPFTELEVQYVSLLDDLRNREQFARIAPETYCSQSLILDTDRDPLDVVLRRTAALLSDLKAMPDTADLVDLESRLVALSATAEATDVADEDGRLALYHEACTLRRKIAFANPLLNFNELVFIKRRRALFNHLCDQYYGMAAAPGGGLYVLEDAFTDNPKVRDVLADSVVEKGRLTGEKLWGGPSDVLPTASFDGNGNRIGPETSGGTFLSPDLSYDARSILFA
ncbi:MAG: discoidin domain-containing protein, partial [Thermoguttaceae bacterium]